MVINTISCVTYINIFFLFSIQFDTSVICKSCPQLYTPKQCLFAQNLTANDTIFDMLECVYGNILARTGHCQQKIKPEICIDSGVHSTCTLSLILTSVHKYTAYHARAIYLSIHLPCRPT